MMSFHRRHIAIAALAISVLSASVAFAQGPSNFPNRPIKIIVGFAPGGPSDIISRVVGAKMGEILGQQVIIENRPGAGGVLASELAARAEPDGYTLLNAPLANAVNETLSKNVKAKVGDGLMAIAPQAETVNILVVHPGLGVKSLAELVALAKAKPGEVQYATAGRGSATHLTSELFDMVAGTKMTAVHYRGGGDTVKDLLSGQVKVMFSSIAPVQQLVKEGRLIGLATTGPRRDPAFPDLPTVAELGYPGFDVRLWIGMTAPAGIPPEVVKKLETANKQALESPDVKKSLAVQGFSPLIGTSEEFDRFYRGEVAKWGKVIQAKGLDKD